MPRYSTRDEQFRSRRQELLDRHLQSMRKRDLMVVGLSGLAAFGSMLIVLPSDSARIAVARPLLFVTWGLFALAITLAFASYQAGLSSTYFQLRSAAQFYLRDRENGGRWERAVVALSDFLGWTGTTTFIAATVCLVIFLSLNSASVDQPPSDALIAVPTSTRQVREAAIQRVGHAEPMETPPSNRETTDKIKEARR